MKRLLAKIGIGIAVFITVATIANVIATEIKWSSEPIQQQAPIVFDPLPTIEDMAIKITPDALYVSINKERVANNLTPYSRNPLLDKSSQAKCADLVEYDYYAHINEKTKRSGLDIAGDIYGYYESGSENLNIGYFKNADMVVKGWMDSDSHRASIIDPQYTEIGFATCVIPSRPKEILVVQHKMNPDEQYPMPSQQRIDASDWLPKQTNCTYSEPSTIVGMKFDGRISCTTN